MGEKEGLSAEDKKEINSRREIKNANKVGRGIELINLDCLVCGRLTAYAAIFNGKMYPCCKGCPSSKIKIND